MSFTYNSYKSTINFPNTPKARQIADMLSAQKQRRAAAHQLHSTFQTQASYEPTTAMLESRHAAMPSAQPSPMPSAPHNNPNVRPYPPAPTMAIANGIASSDCTRGDANVSKCLRDATSPSMPISDPFPPLFDLYPCQTYEPAANSALQSASYPTHDNTCSSSVLCYRPVSTIYRPTLTTKAVLPDSQMISAHSREFSRNQWYAFSRGLHKIDVESRVDILPPARTTYLSNLPPSKPNLYNIPISQSIFAEPSSFENREFQLCSTISVVQASLSTESAQGTSFSSFVFVPKNSNANQFTCPKSNSESQSLFNMLCDDVSKIEPEPPPKFTFKYPFIFSELQMSFRFLYAYGGSNSMGQYQFLDMYRVTPSS